MIIEILRYVPIGLGIIGVLLAAWAIWRTSTEDERKVAWAVKADKKINELKWEIELREREIAREILGEDRRDERSDN